MSLGFQGPPLGNPNVCNDPYTPTFYLGKPGALTAIRMPNPGISRGATDRFSVHDLLDGQAVDRAPHRVRSWSTSHTWLRPEVTTILQEFATRQRGFGPFIFVDPHMKNLLTPNQASGTDALHTTEGFAVTGTGEALSSSSVAAVQGERSLLWQTGVPDSDTVFQIVDTFTRSVGSGWGTADTGQVWASTWTPPASGSASNFGTISTQAFIENTTRSTIRASTMQTAVDSDIALTVDFPIGSATTQPISMWVVSRFTDTSNFYGVRFSLLTTGQVSYWLEKCVAGVFTVLSAVTTVSYTALQKFRVRLRIIGSSIKAKVWATASSVAPSTWTWEVTDTSLTTGNRSGGAGRLETGNTTTMPMYMDFDDFGANIIASSGTLQVKAPTGLYGFCCPVGATYAFSGYIRGFTSTDSVVDVTPRVVALNGAGAPQSAVSGTVITTVTGSWQSFCVTGIVPAATLPYLEPQLSVTGIAGAAGFFVDQLQFELTPTGQCTTWEWGQGQPLVAVQVSGETVPRILRTNLDFAIVEVT